MEERIRPVVRALDRVADWSGQVFCWLIIPLVAAMVYEVIARYAFHAATIWSYDVSYMTYGAHFMLGAAYTLLRGGHIRTDIYYANWSRRTRARVDLACYLVPFFPALIVFAWLGWGYFQRSFELNERIVTSPWLPIVWPFKFVIPAAAVLLLLQGVAETIRCAQRAFGPDEADDDGGGPDGEVAAVP